MKKLVLIMLSLVMLATSLVACSKETEEKLPDGAVPVLSNYPNLEYILPGEYDTSKFEDGTWARYGFATLVAEVDGELAIMPAHTCGGSDAPYISKSEVYKLGDISGGDRGVFLGDELFIPEKCVGMVHSYNLHRLLIFTTTDKIGTIHVMEKDGESWDYFLTENKITIDGKILLVYYEWNSMFCDGPKKIYVVTSTGVSVLHTDEYLNNGRSEFSSIEVERLVTPEWWKYMRPTNGTQTEDGTVWIGEREGVIAINTDGSMTYYPIDYFDAIFGKADSRHKMYGDRST